jgi:hypothetical protein
MNTAKNVIALYSAALKFNGVPVTLKRQGRDGWRAFMPAAINQNGGAEKVSHVDITPGNGYTKMGLKLAMAHRYCAEVFEKSDTVYVNPRHAMKSPKWGSRFGGLPEFAMFMKRAGLIK